MSLNDIRTVIQEWENLPAPGAMTRMREVYRKQLEDIRSQRQRLHLLERELAASLEYLDSCDACDPGRLITACQQCDMHAGGEIQPDLVAGLSAHVEPLMGRTSPREEREECEEKE